MLRVFTDSPMMNISAESRGNTGAVLECAVHDAEELCKMLQKSLERGGDLAPSALYNASQSGWLWASVAFYGPICIFGVIGNILTIAMFVTYIKRTTTSMFIISLATVDLVVCGVSMPMWLFVLFNQGHNFNIVCKVDKFLTFLAVPLSGGILLAIAVDRFLLIYLAVKNNVITMTVFRAKVIVGVIGILCLALAIPQLLSFTTLHELDRRLLGTRCIGSIKCNRKLCLHTETYISNTTRLGLWQAIMIAFMIMILIFTLLYGLIFITVYKTYKKRQRLQRCPSITRRQLDMDQQTLAIDCTASPKEDGRQNGKLVNQIKENSYSDSLMSSEENRLMDPAAQVQPKDAQKAISPNRRKNRLPHFHTAMTLFLVTCSFVVAYAPMILMMFLGSCVGGNSSSEDYNQCHRNDYKSFLWNFFFLNHAINPIIYSFTNPRFKEAIKVCCRKCCFRR